ncbi:MAG: sigma-54 dependent transcriptional regulator [Desulfobacterales bacterium]|nr:sigma-54 dependent transcriptional regulator [Desulfobacterales bacterium]
MQNAAARKPSSEQMDLFSVRPCVPETAQPAPRIENIIGASPRMLEIFDLIDKVADCDSTILINGETGTGKGLVARAIHNKSSRRTKPFISINCGAIPENLLESELFGHVKGAFTGATASKPGKFELADGGTVFLDEIGDMSPDLQVKVLKVLEEGEFEQVGGSKTIKVDVRIIAATHRDLSEEVQKGNFREDLFYRLYVIPMILPSLRERTQDIPLLAAYFLQESNRRNHREVKGLNEDALSALMAHAWPGNVRELKNLVERLVVLKGSGAITRRDLPPELRHGVRAVDAPVTLQLSEEGICLTSAVTEFERSLILQSLEKTQWVKNKAAKLLHLNRTTLVEKIKRHQLRPCGI